MKGDRFFVYEASESNHPDFCATVIDAESNDNQSVCECRSNEDAEMIATALNARKVLRNGS